MGGSDKRGGMSEGMGSEEGTVLKRWIKVQTQLDLSLEHLAPLVNIFNCYCRKKQKFSTNISVLAFQKLVK